MKQIDYVEGLFRARAAGHHAAVASDLPTGTVTFLFTDIEGSTRLLNALGAVAYAQALADHRRLLRRAFMGNGGMEVDTQGDAFFVAFSTAPDALSAASNAQHALSDLPISVRMGLHTGAPLLTQEGYVGADVHRAARVASAGHGGQVLLTAATAALVGNARLVDLGLHRLKDLSAAEHIYQLGDALFPPLKTLYQTNLPVPLAPFLGRAEEVASVVGLASRPDIRLLTLTGPGGTGKTRLAQQSAAELGDRYEGGVWWIPLSSLRDSQLVLETAGRVVGSKNGLAEHIGDSTMLLVFDNFEQVIDAGADVASVLGACPNLRVLVTSREALHVAGEHAYPVPPLTPTDGQDLFLARALAVDPTFFDDGAVAEICRRLDELPLAIELAAARVTVLSPVKILARLDKRLPLLTGGARDAPERQRTLRATIEWSYELLSDDERALFAGLSVFRGGCTLEAAEAVADADLDLLQSLVDKSLLRRRDDRYAMLETLREYAAERLEESGAADERRQRHAAFFIDQGRAAEKFLQQDDITWVERVSGDHDNFRAVFDRLEARGQWQDVLLLGGAIHRFWYVRSHLAEGRRRLESALAADDRPTAARAQALRAASVLTLNLGDHSAALRHARELLELARSLGDQWSVAYALMMLGNATGELNEFSEALAYLEESSRMFAALGDDHYGLIALANVAWVAGGLGDTARDRELNEEVMMRARRAGNERLEAFAMGALAAHARDDGRLDEARAMNAEAMSINHRIGSVLEVALDVGRMASILVRIGEAGAAARLLGYSDGAFDALGATHSSWDVETNEKTMAQLRADLDTTSLVAALSEGRRMTADETVALALQPRSASGT